MPRFGSFEIYWPSFSLFFITYSYWQLFDCLSSKKEAQRGSLVHFSHLHSIPGFVTSFHQWSSCKWNTSYFWQIFVWNFTIVWISKFMAKKLSSFYGKKESPFLLKNCNVENFKINPILGHLFSIDLIFSLKVNVYFLTHQC